MHTFALISLSIRVALEFGVALASLALLRRATAAARRLVLLLAFVAALALPFVDGLLALRPLAAVLPAPASVHAVAEALVGATPAGRVDGFTASVASGGTGRAVLNAVELVWLAGALVLLARLALGVVRARRWVSVAESADATARISAAVESPVVVGLFAPVVLLPPASRDWDDERRRVILLHERAHVERRDGLALFVAQVACALYWFQPFAWLALRQLRRECELLADEDVLAGGVRPSSYAEHLLAVARSLTTPVIGLAMAGRPSELARRIRALVSPAGAPRPLTGRGRLGLATAATVGLALLALGGRAPAASAEHDDGVRDARLQAIAVDEAARARTELGAERVAVLVLEPQTGALLALADEHPNQPLLPASTLKPLLVALALDAHAISADQRFDCGDGHRLYGEQVLTDAAPYGALDAAGILAVSSNIGASRVFDALGAGRFASGMARLHLSAPRELEAGTLKGALAGMGLGAAVTPLALARAYAVLARDGSYVAPGVRPERVVSAATAARVRSMLEGAVEGERATGKLARIEGVRVAGKTGTADLDAHVAHFVGIVPAERPRYVVLVSISASSEVTGGRVAAPVFARVARRALGASLAAN
jgi:cell division protein FtsI (penicillin-binding protein 3)